MDISVYRDEKYYQSWKGQKERSGGVLFNLGIHYFDLLLYLFGQPRKIQTDFLDDQTGTGVIEGDNFICRWKVSTGERRDNQKRLFKINGVDYNFSSQDNLSYENLHRNVYQDLVKNVGITPKEASVSIKLVEDLYSSYK
ncbi:MAG: Gfo/Idh/MocA family oxidoreductase [Candidatus Magasanikbacteria bacterium]|nr:Gfo/Idh/MocA family oxidoreductase [Candidatus Magasanikbacteria bacterium]